MTRKVGTPHQVAIFVCQNIARKDSVELPSKFWLKSEYWKREFARQKQMAQQLCGLYGDDVLVQLTQLPEATRLLSLYYEPVLQPLLKKAQDAIKQKMARINRLTPPPERAKAVVEAPRASRPNKNSIISKLRDLDG